MRALIFLMLLMPGMAFADNIGSLGEVANNLVEPINLLSGFIGTASLIVGICCLFGAFLRYMQYRVNPLVSPLGTVFVLLIMGIVLLCLPFIYKLTESGIPYMLS
jgi:hypothetical protein